MYLWEKLGLNVVVPRATPPLLFVLFSHSLSRNTLLPERKRKLHRVYIWLKGCLTLASFPERKGKEGGVAGGREGISRMGEGGAGGNVLRNIYVKSDLEKG